MLPGRLAERPPDAEIVQGLRPWSPSAPRLPGQSTDTTPIASPKPPDFSDEKREFGEATEPEG